MPTPRVQERQVATAPLPNVRYSTDVPQGATGVASHIDLRGAEQAIGQVYEREVQRANQQVVRDADAAASKLETDILYDPEKGVLNMRGKDALKGRETVDTTWAKGMGEIEKTLSNDTQREAFRNSAATRHASLYNTVSQHINGELKRYDDDQTKSYVGNEQDAAVAAAVKGVTLDAIADRASMAVARQRAAIADWAKRNGIDPDTKDKILNSAASGTHLAVIEQLTANKDDLTAKSYYNVIKEDLKGDDATKAAKYVEEGSIRGESQRQSDAIMLKHPDDRGAALAEARKLSNPDVREATVAQVNQRFNENNAIDRENEDRDYLSAKNIVAANPGQLARNVVPPSLWKRLSLEKTEALERFSGNRENDYKTWHQFLDKTPEQMADLNQSEFESQYWSKFDNQTRTRAELMWAASRDAKRTGKLDPKTAADITFKDQVNMTLKKLELIPRNKPADKLSASDYEFYADFYFEATKEKEAFEAEKKRPATSTEMQGIIDRVAHQRIFVDKPFAHDPQRLPQSISKDEKKRAYIPWDEIPTESQQELHQMIKARGHLSSRDKIGRLYAAYVLKDTALMKAILEER